jgi:hypothetical protein
MKKQFLNILLFSGLLMTASLTGCKDDEVTGNPEPEPTEDRWITVAGALMGTEPGDGNGGTVVYSVTKDNAKNPDYSISVYDNGYAVKSNRTARLQSSEDGKTLFNIAYTGDNGGEFSRYKVNGAASFTQEDVTVHLHGGPNYSMVIKQVLRLT